MPTKDSNHKASYCIIIKKLRLSCVIGIDAAEAGIHQHVLLDAWIMPLAESLGGVPAINYATVVERLKVFAASKTHSLLEIFATEAASMILSDFAAAKVRLYCCKPNLIEDLEEVGVEVTRHR